MDACSPLKKVLPNRQHVHWALRYITSPLLNFFIFPLKKTKLGIRSKECFFVVREFCDRLPLLVTDGSSASFDSAYPPIKRHGEGRGGGVKTVDSNFYEFFYPRFSSDPECVDMVVVDFMSDEFTDLIEPLMHTYAIQQFRSKTPSERYSSMHP